MPINIGRKKSFRPSLFGVNAVGTYISAFLIVFTNCVSTVTHPLIVLIVMVYNCSDVPLNMGVELVRVFNEVPGLHKILSPNCLAFNSSDKSISAYFMG